MHGIKKLATSANLLWLAQFALGMVLFSLAYPLFLIGNDIAPGGVSGIAMIINHLTGARVGLMTFALNVPLFVLGFHQQGWKFIVSSFIAMTVTSFLIDAFKLSALTLDPLLAAFGGAVMLGVGLGLIVRCGASSGGTDLVAMLVHKKLPVLSVGSILLALDSAVVIGAGFAFEPQAALYAMVTVVVSTRVMDTVVEGFNTAKAFFIISEKHEDITRRIMTELERGVTILNARGGWSGAERNVLLCVVVRMQVQAVKRIVRDIDSSAFIILTDAREVVGEGFNDIKV
jgi:uncharacterized membrane-anchored protein YitT (DUF2179 family)